MSIFKTKDEQEIMVECECGHAIIQIQNIGDDQIQEYAISILAHEFSEKQGALSNLFHRLKFTWHIFRYGYYRFQEIILREKDFNEFKEAISKIK